MTKKRLYAHFWKFENRKVKREESKHFPQYYLPATRIVMRCMPPAVGATQMAVVDGTGCLGALPLHGSQHLPVLSLQHRVPEGGWRGLPSGTQAAGRGVRKAWGWNAEPAAGWVWGWQSGSQEEAPSSPVVAPSAPSDQEPRRCQHCPHR